MLKLLTFCNFSITKGYLFGAIIIVFGDFMTKKQITASTDLIFFTTSTQAHIEDETNYNNDGTNLYICPGSTKEIACKLLAVDEKYTHVNALGDIVLNTSADNPQSEPLLTVHATPGTGQQKIDYLTKSDVNGSIHFSTEGTDFTNGTLPEY